MSELLLDSNIVIYLLNKDRKTIDFLKKFRKAIFGISIVSWIEILAGSFHHKKSISELAAQLVRFTQIPLYHNIALKSAQLIQQNIHQKRKEMFKDSVIAATAIIHKIPLITNNPKDFWHFKGLKIISPK